jgi:hypothetical protein
LLLITLAGTAAASFAWSAWQTPVSPVTLFYLLPGRVWEFALGGFLAVQLDRASRGHRGLPGVLAWTGILALLLAAVLFDESVNTPGFAAALPCLGTVALIAAGTMDARNPVSKLLASQPLVLLGKLSYSWYLWHWPALVLVNATVANGARSSAGFAAAIGTLGLAYVTYRFVEDPIRARKLQPFSSSRGSVMAGLSICALLILVGLALDWNAQRALARSERFKALVAAVNDISPLTTICHESFPFDGELAPAEQCTRGSGAGPLIVLWGDSHADHLYPLLESYSINTAIAVRQRSMSSCPPVLGVAPQSSVGPISGCDAFNAAIIRELKAEAEHRPVSVVMAAFWPAYLGQRRLDRSDRRVTFIDAGIDSQREAAAMLVRALGETLRVAQSERVRVLITESIPEMEHDVVQCLAHARTIDCGVDRRIAENQRTAARNALHAAARESTNVLYWDPIDFFCPTDRCPATSGTTVLYRDNHHITATAARSLVPLASSALTELAAQPNAD